jgi:hypothetical protein
MFVHHHVRTLIMKRLLIVLFFLLAMPLTMADGVYLGPVGFVPEIPNQQAVILHKDGVETLLVQSVLDAPKGDYSWVVPLPNEPTDYAAGTDDLFKKWNYATRPETRYQVSWWLSIGPAFCGIVLFGLVLAPFAADKGKVARGWIFTFCVLGLTVSQLNFRRPHEEAVAGETKATEGAAGREVEVIQSRDVGSYRIDVVKGRSSAALAEWLSKNKTPLPSTAESIVRDYVAKGWVFMAVKLREHSGGLLQPHPLAVEFPSTELVYPMRLTGLSKRTLLLDLYVVTQGTVAMDPLKVWFSDRLSASNDISQPATLEWLRLFPFKAGSSADSFGSEAVLTRLRGQILPADMNQDYVGRVGALRPFRLEFYSSEFSEDAAEGWCAWVALACGALAYFGFVRFGWNPVFLAAAVLLLTTVGGSVAWNLATQRYPSLETTEYR